MWVWQWDVCKLVPIKWKRKKYHFVGTIPEPNRKTLEPQACMQIQYAVKSNSFFMLESICEKSYKMIINTLFIPYRAILNHGRLHFIHIWNTNTVLITSKLFDSWSLAINTGFEHFLHTATKTKPYLAFTIILFIKEYNQL